MTGNHRWMSCSIALVLACIPMVHAHAQEADFSTYKDTVLPFLRTHCIACHGPEKQKASFRLDTLDSDIRTGEAAQQWHEVLDMLGTEEMPPEEEPRPETGDIAKVTDWIGKELRRAEILLQSTGRKTVLRRLNRDEYLNTVRDLLGVHRSEWASELPLDGKASGFDTVGSAHSMSATALEKYFNMADRVVEDVFSKPDIKAKHPSKVHRFEAERHATNGISRFQTAEYNYQRGIKTLIGGAIPGGRPFVRAHPELESAVRDNRPTTMEERAALKKILIAELDRRRNPKLDERESIESVPMSYSDENELRIMRYAYWNKRPGVTLDLGALIPGEYKVRVRARGAAYPGAPLSRTIWMQLIETKKTAKPLFMTDVLVGDYQTYETVLEVQQGMGLLLEVPERSRGPTLAQPGDPNLIVDYIEFEGPMIDDAGYQRLFAGWGHTASQEGARTIIARFMERAYRRPVTSAEIDQAMPLIDSSDNDTFVTSLKSALRYILANPRFLYLVEAKNSAAGERQRLDAYELASRLSYFLWSSLPDQQLLDLAASGTLSKPDVLTEQVERLLANEKSEAFVDRFVSQWLELEKLAPLMPDTKLFPTYDKYLVQCLEQEPKLFFREILDQDLSALTFLDSDFAMLNERLARHYGIDGVSGSTFRRVSLGEGRQRGGLLGHGAVLTLTSNGTRTSPVIRGKWVLENLLADPPTPPPANVGALEDVPDIEGQDKLSVRQLLEKHRNVASCNNCHRKIDPYGLALENYDAVGAWRTHEMDFDQRKKALFPVREITVQDELPRGRKFDGLASFKQLLLADQDRFLKCLAEKMLTYALGRTMEFSDEAVREELVAHMRSNDLTLRSLIEGIVQHEVFLTK